MPGKPVLVLATRNAGKIKELRRLLEKVPITVKGLSDYPPFPEPVEDGETFRENAVKKALATMRHLGVASLADDSGLCVEALLGAPGVLSARYGGEGLTDADRCERLLEALKDVADRRAAFMCVAALALPDGSVHTWEGRVEGLILESPEGENGFGYDPVFYYQPFERSFALLSREEKNSVSHRGKAMALFADDISQLFDRLQKPVNP
ncbi:MAG: XTP/dITP diphosphatase [Deltaproteobacteria bacterium]|nr:XTP/dITP diphosphatase [Deltaproteobacteria bacterium]